MPASCTNLNVSLPDDTLQLLLEEGIKLFSDQIMARIVGVQNSREDHGI